MDTIDGPEDPLATARSGGLDSAVELEPNPGRGFLGEVLSSSEPAKAGSFSTAEALRGVKIVQLASGFGRSYALSETGEALRIQSNEGESSDDGGLDVKLESIALGERFAAGVGLEDSRLYCWGEGRDGQLGLGHTRGSRVAEVVPTVRDQAFAQVSCGQMHGAAVAKCGALYTWGRGFEGQLGQGLGREVNFDLEPAVGVRLVPKLVQGLSKLRIVQVACGARFTAAIDSKGGIWTWGEGLMGQLGTGRCTRRSVPARVVGPSSGASCLATSRSSLPASARAEGPEDYADLIPEQDRHRVFQGRDEDPTEAVANASSLGKPEQGQPPCSDAGELKASAMQAKDGAGGGKGSAPEPESSLQLDLSRSAERDQEDGAVPFFFIGVACGEAHLVAVDARGQVVAWGFNAFGQLGDGSTKTRYEPVMLGSDALPPIAVVAAAKNSSSFLSRDGAVHQCGKIGLGGSSAAPIKLALGQEGKEMSADLAQPTSQGGLVALVRTCASSVSPGNGPLYGGHEIRISGVGFWDSGSIKVRFVPLKRKNDGQNNNGSDDQSEFGDSQGDNDGEAEEDEEDEDEEVEEEDSGSLASSSSSSSSARGDGRVITQVDAVFDPESGTVCCTAPPCAAPGVVLVQVAMDGLTFTNDEVFFLYTNPCVLASSSPAFASCFAEGRDAMLEFALEGDNIMALPELTMRLASASSGKVFDVPATLVPAAQPAPEEGDAPRSRPASATSHPAGARAVVNLSEAFDALASEGEDIVDAVVRVSLNGMVFAEPQTEARAASTRFRLARVQVLQAELLAYPCVDDEPGLASGLETSHTQASDPASGVGDEGATHPAAAAEADAKADPDADPDATQPTPSTPVSLEDEILLKCTGLTSFDPAIAEHVRIRFCFSGRGPSIEVPAAMDLELGQVSAKLPLLGRWAIMSNGQGWGFREAQLALTIDGGRCWAPFRAPFVFYWGELEAIAPRFVPSAGGCELEVRVAPEHQGWLFPSCTPVLRLAFDGGLEGSATPIEVSSKGGGLRRSDDGSALLCSLPCLASAFGERHGARVEALQNAARSAYLEEHLPASEEELEALGPEARAEVEAKAEAAALSAGAGACEEPLALSAQLAVNGVNFVPLGDPVKLYEPPGVVQVTPDGVPVACPIAAAAAAAEEEGDSEGADDEPACAIATIVVEAASGVPETGSVVIRFAGPEGAGVHDVPASMKPLAEAVEEPPAEVVAKGKKKAAPSTAKKEEPNTAPADTATRRSLVCQLPRFAVAGEYSVAVALNGADFSAGTGTIVVASPEDDGGEGGDAAGSN